MWSEWKLCTGGSFNRRKKTHSRKYIWIKWCGPQLYHALFDNVELMGNGDILLGGGWNVVMDHVIYCKQYFRVNNRRTKEVLIQYIKTIELFYIWRKWHPRYTWCVRNFRKQARLDYFLCTQGLANVVSKADIGKG